MEVRKIIFSFLNGWFVGSMLIFQGVVTFWSDAEIQGNYDWTEQIHTGVRIQVKM